jgi:hypothetical protein
MKTGRFMGMFGAYLLAAIMNPTTTIGPVPHFRGYAIGGYNPVYFPHRGKLKGYMKENKRCSFNKNR